MELRHLRYFVAVAEELHFGRAAARVGIEQPPFSQQIMKLEQELKVPLLIRSSHRVGLTDAGRALLDQARRTLTEALRCADKAQRAHRGELGEISVGFVQAASVTVLPKVVPPFRRDVPGVRLNLLPMSTARQVDAIHSRDIDVGFLWLPLLRNDLKVEPLTKEAWMVAIAQGDPWSKRRRIPVQMLNERPIVFCERKDTPDLHDCTMRRLAEKNVNLHVIQEADSFSTMVNLVAIGMGVGLVPSSTTSIRRDGVKYLPLQDFEQSLELAVAYDPARVSKALDRFLGVLRETVALKMV